MMCRDRRDADACNDLSVQGELHIRSSNMWQQIADCKLQQLSSDSELS